MASTPRSVHESDVRVHRPDGHHVMYLQVSSASHCFMQPSGVIALLPGVLCLQ